MPWALDLVNFACAKLTGNLQQITRCAGLLSDAECWHRPNTHCNSVGNLVLHLTGNVRQWIVAGLGGEPFERDRPAEFAERGPLPASTVVGELSAAVGRACEVLRGLDAAALQARVCIQSYEVSALVAVIHVVEHFSFHTGQVVHITKALRDVDLSLYDERGHRPDMQNAQP